jgi:hypothetical protein
VIRDVWREYRRDALAVVADAAALVLILGAMCAFLIVGSAAIR